MVIWGPPADGVAAASVAAEGGVSAAVLPMAQPAPTATTTNAIANHFDTA
jgi:hypothetical protein